MRSELFTLNSGICDKDTKIDYLDITGSREAT